MFDDGPDGADILDAQDSLGLLQELERNTPAEIRKQREHFRATIKSNVTLQSGNASELLDWKICGVTREVSQGGLGALFPIPIHVGDVYRIQFERGQIDLPLTFARCLRCRLVREDAYEAGFSFFTPISLPEGLVSDAPAPVATQNA